MHSQKTDSFYMEVERFWLNAFYGEMLGSRRNDFQRKMDTIGNEFLPTELN